MDHLTCPTCHEEPGIIGEPCLNGQRNPWHDAAEDSLRCTCNAAHGYLKAHGPDPARCPVHGETHR